MKQSPREYSNAAEAIVVSLARSGDRPAFEELVRRHQSWLRNLMRRLSGDVALADDLAQQAFLEAWRKLKNLREPGAFNGWLKQVAVNIWLQHARRHDALQFASDELDELPADAQSHTQMIDLNRALMLLSAPVRLCIVLAYNEGMSHSDIEKLTDIPLGTVKSHIRRGSMQLQILLADYNQSTTTDRRDAVREPSQ